MKIENNISNTAQKGFSGFKKMFGLKKGSNKIASKPIAPEHAGITQTIINNNIAPEQAEITKTITNNNIAPEQAEITKTITNMNDVHLNLFKDGKTPNFKAREKKKLENAYPEIPLNSIEEDETPSQPNISQSVSDIKQALQKSKKNGTLFKDNPTAIRSTQNFLTNLSDKLQNSTPKTIEKDIILLLLEENKPLHIPKNLNASDFDKYNDQSKFSPSDIRMLHGISKHLTDVGKIEATPASGAIIKTLGKILDPYPEKFSKLNYIFEKTNQDFKIVGPSLKSDDREKLQIGLDYIGTDIALLHRYENLPLSGTHHKLLINLKKSAVQKHQAGEQLSRQENLILTKQNPNINLKTAETALSNMYSKLQEPVYKSKRPIDKPLYTPRPRPN